MALNMQDKKSIVSEMNAVAKKALSAVVVSFRGIKVDKMNEIRKAGRNAGVDIRVVRNTMMRRIVEETDFECLKETFVGPTLVAFSITHPGAAARLFKRFANENTTLEIKAAAFEKDMISGSEIDRLATLPTYTEAIVRLRSLMKEAAVGKLIRTLFALQAAKKS